MFTGIVEGIGTIVSKERRGSIIRMEIKTNVDLSGVDVGSSIAVNGCCLTITSRLGNRFWVDIGSENLHTTTLGGLCKGARVNIELPLVVGKRVGGHLVQGHVDGVGKVIEVINHGGAKEIAISIAPELNKYVVCKGSIAVDGVSLTVNKVVENKVHVFVVPQTLVSTTLSDLVAGSEVNIEVDVIGKYVEKLRFVAEDELRKRSKITLDFLKKHGF